MNESQLALTRMFDEIVSGVVSEDSALSHEQRVKFITHVFKEMHGFGWEEYATSNHWLFEEVQAAYQQFLNCS